MIENALFYSTLNPGKHPEVTLEVSRENSHLNFSLHDSGTGISEAAQPRIWEMFYIGDEQSRGNGLGLYIAKKALGVLNGYASFITEENSFTEFQVVLLVSIHTNGAPVS